VFVDGGVNEHATTARRVEGFESRLVSLGYVVSRSLNEALRRAEPSDVTLLGDEVLGVLGEARGGNRPHVPLFRRFPLTVPRDTVRLYVERVLTHVLASPDQPCLFCGRIEHVWILDPCGHLVCGSCWDGADYSACPICHRRINLSSPFLKPARPREPDEDIAVGRPLTLLDLGSEPEGAGRRVLASLAAHETPLSPRDREDLLLLLDHFGSQALSLVPDRIPVKETMALLFGTLLKTVPVEEVAGRAVTHVRTATDVLRILFVWMGGAPDLLEVPKPRRSPTRPLRRFVMDRLESQPLELLIEDMKRHPGLWKMAGEKLHPFEFHRSHPNTVLAFAVVRETRLGEQPALGDALRAASDDSGGTTTIVRSRVRLRSWSALVEESSVISPQRSSSSAHGRAS